MTTVIEQVVARARIRTEIACDCGYRAAYEHDGSTMVVRSCPDCTKVEMAAKRAAVVLKSRGVTVDEIARLIGEVAA